MKAKKCPSDVALSGIVFCIVLMMSQWVLAIDTVTTIDLPSPAIAFACAPSTSTVAILTTQGKLTFYARLVKDGDLRNGIEPAGNVSFCDLAHKTLTTPTGAKGYYLALSKEKSLLLFDDHTFALVKTIPLSGEQPAHLAVAYNPDDPWVVYANAVTTPYSSSDPPHRVNLLAGEDRGKITLIGDPHVEQVLLSGDGSKLYTLSSHDIQKIFEVWNIFSLLPPDAPAAGKLLIEEHVDFRRPGSGVCLSDPTGQYIIFDARVFTADMQKTAFYSPATPIFFSAQMPVVFVLQGHQMTAISTNTFKPFGNIDLPHLQGEPAAGPAGTRIGVMAPGSQWIGVKTVLEDANNKTLMVCTDTQMVLVPESSFRIMTEPWLSLTAHGSVELRAGYPWSLQLAKRDDQAKIELLSPPPGMTLRGDTLSWTPDASAIGPVAVELKVSDAGLEHQQEINLSVRGNSISLPFAPEDVQLSEDGKTALVFCFTNPMMHSGIQTQADWAYFRVAVVNLDSPDGTAQVVADRTLKLEVDHSTVVSDQRYLYLPMARSGEVQVLSKRDLSDVRQLSLPGKVQHAVATGDAIYFLCMSAPQGISTQTRFACTIPKFQEIPLPSLGNYSSPFYIPGEVLPDAVGQYWLDDGVLYDHSRTKPLLLLSDTGFISYESLAANKIQSGPYPHPIISSWGLVLHNGNLSRIDGQVVGAIDSNIGSRNVDQEETILDDVPAIAAVRINYTQTRVQRQVLPGRPPMPLIDRRRDAMLEFYNLIDGSKVSEVSLMDASAERFREDTGILRSASDQIVAVIGSVLFTARTRGEGSAIDSARFPIPLHWQYAQSVIAVEGDKISQLKNVAEGGTGPLVFSLPTTTPGIEINSASGLVSLDGALLSQRVATNVVNEVQRHYRGFMLVPTTQPGEFEPLVRRTDGTSTFADGLSLYIRLASLRFKRLTGHAPLGVPVALPLKLLVHDQTQQSAVLSEVVLLDVPTQLIMDSSRAVEAQQQPYLTPSHGNFRGAHRPPATSPSALLPPSTDVAALRARLSELEKENAELAARYGILIDRLHHPNIQNGPTTQDAPTTRP